jgi:aldehyde:ferredoxin oxidoreductase
VREAARRIGKGATEYAIHVKGLELPGYDPRGAKAQGLNYLTSNTGADHCSGYAPQEIFGTSIPKKVDRFSVEDKGELTKWNQDLQAMTDTGVLCHFAVSQQMVTPALYGKLLSAATGVKEFTDEDYLWLVGERIFNLERMFNIREGFSRKDDVFPKRITAEKLFAGKTVIQSFEEELLLLDYYKMRGWDLHTGIPTKAKINELGLDFTLKTSP